MSIKKRFGVVILAAGHSKRMGSDKANLLFTKEHTFLDQLILQYSLTDISQIAIIAQDSKILSFASQNNIPISFIQNMHPEKGRSYSIYLGLQQLKELDFVFIQNIDNPFTTKELIELMINQAQDKNVLFPYVNEKRAHPVLLPFSLVNQILSEDVSSFDFKKYLSSFPSQHLPWLDSRLRANINTMEEYKKWIKFT